MSEETPGAVTRLPQSAATTLISRMCGVSASKAASSAVRGPPAATSSSERNTSSRSTSGRRPAGGDGSHDTVVGLDGRRRPWRHRVARVRSKNMPTPTPTNSPAAAAAATQRGRVRAPAARSCRGAPWAGKWMTRAERPTARCAGRSAAAGVRDGRPRRCRRPRRRHPRAASSMNCVSSSKRAAQHGQSAR